VASAPCRLTRARKLGGLDAGGSAKLVGGGAPSWPHVVRGQLESVHGKIRRKLQRRDTLRCELRQRKARSATAVAARQAAEQGAAAWHAAERAVLARQAAVRAVDIR
jgi:hypothetical protein